MSEAMELDTAVNIPENITLRDVYELILYTRRDLTESMQGIKKEVTELKTNMEELRPRLESCESRIAAIEDDLDVKFKEYDATLQCLTTSQDKFPIDTTLVCTGLQEHADENIYEKAQDLIENGLSMPSVQVQAALRMPSQNRKPGLVKIRLPSLEDKIMALRSKYKLDENGYHNVYLRSSMTHQERMMRQNFQTLLHELPSGNQYRIAANGKLIRKETPLLGAPNRQTYQSQVQ